MKAAGGWQQTMFVCGDIDGDSMLEWAFIEPAGDLAIVTASGEKLAAIPGQSGVGSFVILPDKNGRGLLITLQRGTVQAYSFQ